MRVVFVSLAAAFLGLVPAIRVGAQSISIPAGASSPQAKTGDEIEAFGLLYNSKSTEESAAASEAFLGAYPESEFIEYAAASAMHSYHELGNWQRSRELSEFVLKANAENVDALLHRARLLIDPRHEEKANREEARRLAEDGLSKLKRLTIPRSAGSQRWLRTRNTFVAVGTSVLGWLSFREGAIDKSLEYLKQAVLLDGQGEYLYRLSLVAAVKLDLPASREWASQALAVGPEWVRVLARRQIASLELTKK